MEKLFIALVTVSVFVLAACTAVPVDDITIRAKPGKLTDFKAFKTYGWLGSQELLNDPEGKWEPTTFDVNAEILFLINQEMRDRDFIETNTNPDLVITYVLGIDMAALKVNNNPENKMMMAIENIPREGLFVFMIDSKTRSVVWMASAVAETKKRTPEITKRRLEYTISQMFKKIPK